MPIFATVHAFSRRSRAAYDGRRPYRPYLFTIARNILADWGRSRRREILLARSFGAADGGTPRAHLDEAQLANRRTMLVVEQFVRQLPADLRALHDQRFVCGLSQREAAAALGLSRQSVRTLEARLRVRLQRTLDDHDASVDAGPLRARPICA